MGYRDYPSGKKVSIWSEHNALMMLIILNVFAFITLRFIMAVYGLSHLSEEKFYTNIFQWFALPGEFTSFMTRPWTMISGAFTHLDFMLLLSNMLWLWTFGYIFQDLTGNRSIIPLYLYGAVVGSLGFLVSFALFKGRAMGAETTYYFGATAAIISVAVGTTVLAPGYRLFPMINGGLPIWVLTLVFLIIDVFYLTARPLWLLPHLAAALMAVAYVLALRNGRDWGNWMNQAYEWLVHLFDPKKIERKRRRARQEVFYHTGGKLPFRKQANLTQQRIDEILDKMNQKGGYENLSEEEKEVLKRASQEDL
jgi:membrane associated rhomboid family serine protease